ncbi:odorant receptor 131-2-like [Oryzias melastigma]|uniref:Mu-type opioid receptor-like n=1 Tax=Oryzias melastigma TaxID=30732 RepID=A0A3B3B9N8_ORYME|nr:odorant receptor 131-2-like [Oryzias melastigma]
MALNGSVSSGGFPIKIINNRVIIVQVSIALFLSINFFLISTFFRREVFYTTMRYILFAVTLLSDCLFLILTDSLLVLSYFDSTMDMWLCLIMYIILSVYSFVTPLTLTAMTLERYVAICMPLRHAELCTPHGALQLIFIIHSISAVSCTVNLSIFVPVVSPSFFTQRKVCSVEMFILFSWQGHLRSAVGQFYFLLMLIVIVFSYVKILKVAKTASGENKKSTWKGLRTVILHGFQLLLGLIQLWCPFIEAAVLKIDLILYINVRFFNYIIFFLAPRCLSPLIYGLRDELFFQALKSYALCGLGKKHNLL